jgi:hypothetical protein
MNVKYKNKESDISTLEQTNENHVTTDIYEFSKYVVAAS